MCTLLKYLSRLAPSLLLACSLSSAAFVNPGFEEGTLAGWNSVGNVNVSAGESYGPAGVVTPYGGPLWAALLNAEGVPVTSLVEELGVSTNTLEATNGGTTAFNGTLLWQTISANAGDTVQIHWNFVERDGPNDDWSFFGVSLDGGAAELERLASAADLSGSSAGVTVGGWQTKTVNITTAGTYTFYLGVVNANSGAGTDPTASLLWVDGANLIPYEAPEEPGEVPEPGTVVMFLAGLACIAAKVRLRKA